ncbi:MAG TPA: thiamine phosphate synthase [Candidatus Dormibacteraeota bacterium]|nr:thiamine phosphate synthase [Candidatus Dormibacteraeota bacterium]
MSFAGGSKPPIVCYVTDRKALGSGSSFKPPIATIRAAVAAGVDWVQIREKDLVARDLLALTTSAISATNEARKAQTTSARVIVNDRLDVALTAGAAGVHLGRNSISVADVARWCRGGNAPPEFLIGVSCHSFEEARQAQAAGANYIFFGPVYDTPSKRPFGPPHGVQRLAEVCGALRIPVVAIGGVDGKNAAECLRAGAAGIAAIRFFQEDSGTVLAERIAKLRG